jgi:hypothetical protein
MKPAALYLSAAPQPASVALPGGVVPPQPGPGVAVTGSTAVAAPPRQNHGGSLRAGAPSDMLSRF